MTWDGYTFHHSRNQGEAEHDEMLCGHPRSCIAGSGLTKYCSRCEAEETVKIYQVSDADWIATDVSKEDTAKWYDTACGYGLPDGDVVWFLDDWVEVDPRTVHLRDIAAYSNEGKEDRCTMQETIDEYLKQGNKLPFVVSTTEW